MERRHMYSDARTRTHSSCALSHPPPLAGAKSRLTPGRRAALNLKHLSHRTLVHMHAPGIYYAPCPARPGPAPALAARFAKSACTTTLSANHLKAKQSRLAEQSKACRRGGFATKTPIKRSTQPRESLTSRTRARRERETVLAGRLGQSGH